jgi:hypothetical protein
LFVRKGGVSIPSNAHDRGFHMTTFTLNGAQISLDADPDMPLLWALRDHAGLTGT